MNKKGNIMLNFLFFTMALIVVFVFISPINTIIDLQQQSDSLNCKGFIYDGNVTHPLSFDNQSDGGQSGSPMSCLVVKLYLPYILLVFLVYGLFSVLGNRAADMVGQRSDSPTY